MDFDKFAYRRKESAFPQLSQADEQTVRTVYDYKVLTSSKCILQVALQLSSCMAFNTTNGNVLEPCFCILLARRAIVNIM